MFEARSCLNRKPPMPLRGRKEPELGKFSPLWHVLNINHFTSSKRQRKNHSATNHHRRCDKLATPHLLHILQLCGTTLTPTSILPE